MTEHKLDQGVSFSSAPCRVRAYSFVLASIRDADMLYAILCYNSEEVVYSWSQEEDDKVMADLDVVHQKLLSQGQTWQVEKEPRAE